MEMRAMMDAGPNQGKATDAKVVDLREKQPECSDNVGQHLLLLKTNQFIHCSSAKHLGYGK
jgi:hypothetical protein